MKNLGVFIFSILSALSAQAIDGTITSAPTLFTSINGEIKAVPLASKLSRFRIWEDGKNIYIYTSVGENDAIFKCGKPLGALVSPLSLNVVVDGQEKVMTIPAQYTFVFANGACKEGGGARILQIDSRDEIVFDVKGSSTNRLAAQKAFEADRADAKLALENIKKEINSKNFVRARQAISSFTQLRVLPPEQKIMEFLLAGIPESERPVTTDPGDAKGAFYVLNQDVITLNSSQFLQGFNDYFSVFRNNSNVEAPSMIWILGDAYLPVDLKVERLKWVIETTLRGVFDVIHANDSKNELSVSPGILIDDSLKMLGQLLKDDKSKKAHISYIEELIARTSKEVESDKSDSGAFKMLLGDLEYERDKFQRYY